jgi:hypothetical protein
MRFSTQPHPWYCGSDRHARSMDVCLVHQDGAILVPRPMQAAPEPLLTAVAPSRDGRVVAVACLLPWSGLADRWTPEGIPFGRGHALSLPALHGGKATHDTSASPTLAALRRRGLRPQAEVSPAARRATPARLRRRRPRRRPRAARLAHLHPTQSQAHRPARGQQRASQAHRAGGAARWPAPAGPPSRAGDRALRDADAPLRHDVAVASVRLAQPPAPAPCSRRPAVPGSGPRLRLVRLSDRHALRRCPRGHAVRSAGRRVTGAQAAAGKRDGPAGAQLGNASRTGACADAAGRLRRAPPAGHKSLPTLAPTPGQGTALTLLAQPRARAVSDLCTRHPACALPPLLQASCAARGSPTPPGPDRG